MLDAGLLTDDEGIELANAAIKEYNEGVTVKDIEKHLMRFRKRLESREG